MKNYYNQWKGSHKNGSFALIGSTCWREFVHTAAVKDNIIMHWVSYISQVHRDQNRSLAVFSADLLNHGPIINHLFSIIWLNNSENAGKYWTQFWTVDKKWNPKDLWYHVPTSRPTPADAVVVEVLAALRAEHLYHHTVEVEALHQHPGKSAQKEEVKQDGHDLTGQLGAQENTTTDFY